MALGTGLFLSLTGLGPVAGASAAAVGTVVANDGAHSITFTAGDGDANSLYVTYRQGPDTGTNIAAWEYTFDDGQPIRPGTGCVRPDDSDPTVAVCTLYEWGDFWVSLNVNLGDRADSLVMKAGDENVIRGGSGNDVLMGTGHDRMHGDDGADTLIGGGGMYGGPGNDTIVCNGALAGSYGGSGNDTLVQTARSGALYGGTGNDVLQGGPVGDRLYGNSGDDYITGGAGDDVLSGGPDDDQLWGNSGNDTLRGGQGRDRLSGGPGNDSVSQG